MVILGVEVALSRGAHQLGLHGCTALFELVVEGGQRGGAPVDCVHEVGT